MELRINNRVSVILMLMSLYFPLLHCQESVIEGYIREGLENNLSLKMKLDDYHQSLQSLSEARGLFLPGISFNARYSRAEGGRIIEFPAGDMLNPVYSTLNQLTMSNLFSEISNQEFAFLRPEEHETKLRLVQPLFNSDIYYNHKIKSNLVQVEKASMETYRRALVAEIKKAYFSYLKALAFNHILLNTKALLEENMRVTRSLFENNKVTKDAVYRSEAEYNKLIQQLAEADKGARSSAAWFNFLLNRELQMQIIIEEPSDTLMVISHEPALNNALACREEISVLESYYDAGLNTLKMNRAKYLPELLAVVDYGFQGSRYRFTGEDDFAMASLLLRWDIFNGSIRRAKNRQAQIGLDKAGKMISETENSVKLEVLTAYYSLQAASEKIPAAKSELLASGEAFRLVEKKYRQGQASLIEYIDARNNKTNAELGLAVARYDLSVAWAEFERAAALF